MMKWLPIHFHRTGESIPFRPVRRLQRAALHILRQEALPHYAVQVFWLSEGEIAEMNFSVKKRRVPTDVLSFPRADARNLGDIFISVPYAKKMARKNRARVEDVVLRWVVHGIFHILGYDHMDSRDADVMEEREREVIRQVGGNFVTP